MKEPLLSKVRLAFTSPNEHLKTGSQAVKAVEALATTWEVSNKPYITPIWKRLKAIMGTLPIRVQDVCALYLWREVHNCKEQESLYRQYLRSCGVPSKKKKKQRVQRFIGFVRPPQAGEREI